VIYRSIQIEKEVAGYATLNPNTNIIYISYPFSNFILAVNITKGSIEGKISASSPGNIVVNHVTNKVYVSSADGISQFNGITKKNRLINTGYSHSTGTVNVNQVTNTLYTTCESGDIVTVIDATKGSIATMGLPSPTGKAVELLLVIDMETGIEINRGGTSENAQVGFAFNRLSNTLYMRKGSKKTISKFDSCAKKKLDITTLEKASIWRQIVNNFFPRFAEVIAVNPSTNKVYVSDSKNNLIRNRRVSLCKSGIAR